MGIPWASIPGAAAGAGAGPWGFIPGYVRTYSIPGIGGTKALLLYARSLSLTISNRPIDLTLEEA